MDYQFNQDYILGCQASFAMPHEAFGHWLNAALHQPQHDAELSRIIRQAESVLAGASMSWEHASDEYQLILEDGSARICHQSLSEDYGLADAGLENDFDFYDEEADSHCGLEDFIDALTDWQSFVRENSG
ncbi:YacL family protein [Aliamphritea hakodatensis]|uniref:YacL family protein n=1 Tax=Aliamphritea hakodatensis TaxID=2895352 RepID=UPI0022FD8A52|nr:YacL family protein [Aliamphritea hakodatensis]